MRSRVVLPLVAAVVVLTSACAGGGVTPASAGSRLTVFAAASLKESFTAIKAAYESANPGTTIMISFDASSALRTQIEQGAPADAFFSADTTNPQKLADAGLTTGAPVTFAGNLLTVIVPTANPAGISSPADLARSGVKVIAATDQVPIAAYTQNLLANLAKHPGYPADYVAMVNANVVSREENVKALVTKVELGEGDAGIVYSTDARASTKVATVAVPADANVPATYAGAVVKASRNVAAATGFLTWVAGPDGQAILAQYGFLPPPE